MGAKATPARIWKDMFGPLVHTTLGLKTNNEKPVLNIGNT